MIVVVLNENTSTTGGGGGGSTGGVGASPVAAFTWFDDNPVRFSDLSTGNPTTWEWYVNGSLFSNAQNPSYYFNVPGPYSIRLKVQNANGADEVTQTVSVSPSSF